MRKHYKLITGVICVFLCACLIVFGVYAASHANVQLNSSVTFTPSTAKLKVFGGISGCKEDNNADALKYYACNYKTEATSGNYEYESDTDTAIFNDWLFNKINFDDNYIESESQKNPNSIYFYIQATNYVEENVQFKISVLGGNEKIDITYGYYLKPNSELALTDAALASEAAKNNGFFDILQTSKQHPNFVSNVPEIEYKGFDPVDETKPNGSLVSESFPSGGAGDTSSLSTIMIVVKLDLLDSEQDLEDFNFKFVISAINTQNA